MPKASIILSSYNNLPALELSIESLRYQTEKDFEIIIADDGSTDGTIEYLEKEGIQYFSRPNEGYRLAYIWNRGAELATGDRFIFGNADIISHPKRIEEHLNFNNDLVAGIYPSIPIEKVPLITSKIIADKFEDIILLATHDRRKDFINKIKRPHLVHGKKYRRDTCMEATGLVPLISLKSLMDLTKDLRVGAEKILILLEELN